MIFIFFSLIFGVCLFFLGFYILNSFNKLKKNGIEVQGYFLWQNRPFSFSLPVPCVKYEINGIEVINKIPFVGNGQIRKHDYYGLKEGDIITLVCMKNNNKSFYVKGKNETNRKLISIPFFMLSFGCFVAFIITLTLFLQNKL